MQEAGIYVKGYSGQAIEKYRFSAKASRCIILAGVPFKPWTDFKLKLKMDFLNIKFREGLSKVNGNTWYEEDAARTANRSVSKIIKHSKDYGVVILVSLGDLNAVDISILYAKLLG